MIILFCYRNEGDAQMPMTWEQLDKNTDRTAIPGGWLVRSVNLGESSGITFVPDEKHRWDGHSVPYKFNVKSDLR